MTEYPVFIPVGAEHVAAVVTVPGGPPRALILLVQGGGGIPRSYHNATWTRTTRRLADRGFASVRMEWRGVGDSTGVYRIDLAAPPVDELRAVVETAMRTTGVTRLGLAAECGGAAAALGLSAELAERCRSTAVIKLTLPGRQGASWRSHDRGGAGSPASASQALGRRLRRHPALERTARRLYWRYRLRASNAVLEQLVAFRRSGPVILLGFRAGVKYGAVARGLERRYGVEPFVVEDVPYEGPLGLPDKLGREDFIAKRLLDWFDATLPGPAASLEGQGTTG